MRMSRLLAALAVGLATSAMATPTFAQRSEGMSTARASALHECTKKAGKMKQYTWGVQQLDVYRSCMAQRGQEE